MNWYERLDDMEIVTSDLHIAIRAMHMALRSLRSAKAENTVVGAAAIDEAERGFVASVNDVDAARIALRKFLSGR